MMQRAVRPGETPLPDVQSLASMIKGWERGDHIPGDRYQEIYSRVTGKTVEELFPEPPHSLAAAPTGTVDLSTIPDNGDDDVRRRAALRLVAALGAGATIPPGILEDLLSGIDGVLDRHTDLEEWERVVDDYGRQLYRQSFDSLIPALTADIVAVGELLMKGRSPREQVGLLRVSAGLSGLLAETLCNLGDGRAARRAWNTARRAADESADRALQVWVRGRAAQHASWAGGSHRSVMTMMNEATQIADGTPSSGLARAYAAGACTAALHGDAHTSRMSMDLLKRTFEKLPHSSSEPTVLAFQESQLHWNDAYIRTISGDNRAGAAIDHAWSLYPSTATPPIVNLRLMRAVTLVKEGQASEGLDLATKALMDRPRPVLATRQLVFQLLDIVPDDHRTLPAARELRALTAAT
ncbi:XRE family transcriptional regulator [Actinomadura fulvescens]